MVNGPQVGFKLPNCGGILCEPGWARPQTILRLAGLAREMDYDSLWLHDHLLTPRELRGLPEPRFYEPMVVMAALAGAVPDMTIGVATLIAPLREPVLLYKQMVALEHFFPGRTIVGIGVGQYESEFEAFGTPTYRQRGRITNEYLELMQALSRQEAATFTGTQRSVTDAATYPKLVFGTQPPIWIGGNSEAAVDRARRYGSGWICSSALTPADVRARLAHLAADSPRLDVALTATVANADIGGTREGAAGTHKHSSVIVGSADTVAARLGDYVDAGIGHLLLTFRSPDLDALQAQLRWFAADVRPQLDQPQRNGNSRGEA